MTEPWIKLQITSLPHALSVEEEARLIAFLSREEQERLTSITHPSRRINYLTGHALVRTMAAQHFDLKPHQVPLIFNAAKKPLIHVENHHLSLSHSDQFAVVALGNVSVGVDVESFTRKADVEALAQNHCSLEEQNILIALPEGDARRSQYFKLWSLKEAFYKASGLGVDFKQTSFDLDEKISCRLNGVLLDAWNFKLRTIGQNEYLAIAFESADSLDMNISTINSQSLYKELNGATQGEMHVDFTHAG